MGGNSVSKLLAGQVNDGPSMGVMHSLCSVDALQLPPETTSSHPKIGTSLQPSHGMAVVVELVELVIVLVVIVVDVLVDVTEVTVIVVVVDVCTV